MRYDNLPRVDDRVSIFPEHGHPLYNSQVGWQFRLDSAGDPATYFAKRGIRFVDRARIRATGDPTAPAWREDD